MAWFKKYFSTPNKNVQEQSRNKRALECLRALSFGQIEIRKALVELNRVRVKDLAAADGISAATIYNTIRGRRMNPKAMELVARSLDLEPNDLFAGVGDEER